MIPIRQYQKQLAKINQVLAAEADEVTEVIYGIPWKLKAKEGRRSREDGKGKKTV